MPKLQILYNGTFVVIECSTKSRKIESPYQLVMQSNGMTTTKLFSALPSKNEAKLVVNFRFTGAVAAAAAKVISSAVCARHSSFFTFLWLLRQRTK